MRYLILTALVATVALGGTAEITRANTSVLDTRSDYVEVYANGKHFYGLHLDHEISNDGNVAWECSAVVLCPWSERPHFSVRLEGDTTVVTINGEQYRVKGRHVCVTDEKGTFLMLFPGEITVAAYKNRETLQKAIEASIAKANKALPQ